jgi:hypothetical protein
MSHYLKSVWAMLSPSKPETLPLLPHKPDDLEACAHDNASDHHSIVLVCEPVELPLYTHAHHVRVSPFSENHFPPGIIPHIPHIPHIQQTASTHA